MKDSRTGWWKTKEQTDERLKNRLMRNSRTDWWKTKEQTDERLKNRLMKDSRTDWWKTKEQTDKDPRTDWWKTHEQTDERLTNRLMKDSRTDLTIDHGWFCDANLSGCHQGCAKALEAIELGKMCCRVWARLPAFDDTSLNITSTRNGTFHQIGDAKEQETGSTKTCKELCPDFYPLPLVNSQGKWCKKGIECRLAHWELWVLAAGFQHVDVKKVWFIA